MEDIIVAGSGVGRPGGAGEGLALGIEPDGVDSGPVAAQNIGVQSVPHHDRLGAVVHTQLVQDGDRKSTRLNSSH